MKDHAISFPLRFVISALFLVSGQMHASAAAADTRSTEAYRSVAIPISISSTQTTQALLRIPKGEDKKLPVMVIFGGFESAGKVLDLIHPQAPVALASFDYPFQAPRHLRFPQSLAALPEAKRLFSLTESGIAKLIQVLKQRPEIDPDRITLVGASFGAPFALAAASAHQNIHSLVLVHGFGQVPETAENVLLRSWRPRLGWIADPLAWLLTRLLWAYLNLNSPESYAETLGPEQRVLMITAEQDSFIPRSSSESLWAALQRSNAKGTRLVMPGDHLMPGSDRLIDQIIGEVQKWLAR